MLIQEIFGQGRDIRELAWVGFAAEEDGYETIAPSLYDRQQPGFQSGYERRGRGGGATLLEAAALGRGGGHDLAACIAALRPPVFVAGYCWGGAATLAGCLPLASMRRCRLQLRRAAHSSN